jgi:CDP-glucose 4,6-dehydratase
MDPEFWNGRSVFVTGHTGFKGSWLTLWLERLGARVTGYSLPPPTTPSMFVAARIADGIASVEGDVRDAAALAAALRRNRPEVVFHLAAQAIVRTGYQEPVETYATNVMGTCHLLEAVRAAPGVRAVVVVTSDKCYADTGGRAAHGEGDPMGGHDPYSSSKGCAELLTAAYRLSFLSAAAGAQAAAAVASARAGNVIGGGDWGDHRLVPDVVRAVAAGEPVQVRSPNSVRPWQHVVNPLSGYLLLAEELCRRGEEVAEGWNFGPDERDCRPVSWLVERLTQRWGDGARWQAEPHPGFHETSFLMLDCAKARDRLGWRPPVEMETAVDWLVDWYRLFAAGGDVRGLTLEQIAATQDRLASLRAAE